MQKVEELTLYLIEQQAIIQKQQTQLIHQAQKMEDLEKLFHSKN